MARYIDADVLCTHFKILYEHAQTNGMYNHAKLYDRAFRVVVDAPTADVVPKSEVEELIRENESFAKTVNEASDLIRKLKSKIAPRAEVELLEREVRLLTENSITAKYPHCVIGSYYAVLTKSLEDYERVIADISSVAKAEVAREIFEEIENDYADFLFDGCRNIIVLTEKDYAELKKKYTEGEK